MKLGSSWAYRQSVMSSHTGEIMTSTYLWHVDVVAILEFGGFKLLRQKMPKLHDSGLVRPRTIPSTNKAKFATVLFPVY